MAMMLLDAQDDVGLDRAIEHGFDLLEVVAGMFFDGR
jgi:hypothetical protein